MKSYRGNLGADTRAQKNQMVGEAGLGEGALKIRNSKTLGDSGKSPQFGQGSTEKRRSERHGEDLSSKSKHNEIEGLVAVWFTR